MHRTPLEASPERLVGLRRRTVRSLFSGVALGSTGYIAAVTIGTIVARDLSGSPLLSGAPGAAVVLGAAGGAAVLSRLMIARGRRFGLTTGYVISVVGAAIATWAVIDRAFPLLLLGTLLIGFGNASNQLSRYAAADLYPAARRASAIGLVVWGATVGAVIGPNLIGIAGTVGESIGMPPLAAAYVLPILFVGAAAILSFVALRPDPYRLADQSDLGSDDGSTVTSLRRIFARPNVPIAIIALITVQVVMVLIMTMTPLHMTEHGHDLAAVGIVISGHTFGMFALSPISGRLTDRFGSYPVVLAGLVVTAGSGLLSAVAPVEGGILLFVALFLLGYGWNLGFVAGSALLTVGLGLSERTRVQGLADALIWSSAAAASIGSGVVVAAAGYATLGLIGAALVIVPTWLLLSRSRRVAVTAD
jgi:MFS family permease